MKITNTILPFYKMILKKIKPFFIVLLLVMSVSMAFPQTDKEKNYQDAIASADAYFKDQDYINAKASYQYAQKLKPDEQYPKDKLQETIKRLREKMMVMEEYNTELTAADKHFRQKEYGLAKERYKAAAKILPTESYPGERLTEIENIETEAKGKQDDYDKAVADGEKLITYKKYDKAIGEFERAAVIFPSESYPKEKIKELEVLRDKANKADAAYDELIASADRLYNLKYYQNAKDDYEKALEVKPGESFPTERIKAIDAVLVKKNEYDQLVADADEMYISKSLEEAKSKYQESLKIYPGESYPKGMIDKINTALNSEKDTEELYQKAIADANTFIENKDYTNAISEYENASSIKPNESLPKTKIEEIKGLIAKAGADEIAYNKAIEKGEQLFGAKDYVAAKTEFETAAKLKPAEQFPKDRLSEINKAISANQELQDRYDQFVVKADGYFDVKDYDNAITEYNKALVVIPGQKYATDRIAEINVLQGQQLENAKNYAKLIGEADKFYEKKNYTEARLKYVAAKEIDDKNTYPDEKILAIDRILTDQQSNEEAYLLAIKTGDDLFGKKDYETALTEYQKANQLKPGEKYPAGKIDEISGILGGQKLAQEKYTAAISSADAFFEEMNYKDAQKKYQSALVFIPDDEHATTRLTEIRSLLAAQSELDTKYFNLLSEAESTYKTGNLEEAKAKYTAALLLKPNEPIPSERLKGIDAEIAAKADKQKSYDEAVTAADAFVENGDYANAKLKYKEASRILPGEQYPKAKLNEVAALVIAMNTEQSAYEKAVSSGDRLLIKKDYPGAKLEFEKANKLKPSEAYPSEKITEIDLKLTELAEQQKSYDQSIVLADQLFNEKKYNQAKIEYQKATGIKPNETYPSNRTKEIDDIIANQAFTLKQYNQTITEADQLFDAGKYDKALVEYQQASDMQASEQYPKQRIVEINQLIASQDLLDEQYLLAITTADDLYKQKSFDEALTHYQEAAGLKPDAKRPKERITEITTFLTATQKEGEDYANAIKEGDNLFALKDYEKAKLAYMKAGNIKKDEQYPKDKIAEIEQIILQQKTDQAEYNKSIAAADRMMDSKEYNKAKAKYEEAKTILPNEQYPTDKLAEITSIALAMELEVQNKYNDAIEAADNLLTTKDYEPAIIKYREALKFKPKEEYPIQKIAEIERLVTDFETLKVNYNKLIADADRLFKAKDYSESKPIYVEAAALMPDETYPTTKIEEINLIFKAQLEKQQQDYDNAIADADKFFAAQIFDKALDSYRIAKKVKPEESYPDEMIGKIMKILDENAVRDLLSSTITIEDQAEKKFDFEPVSVTDRKKSFIYIKARNTSDVAFKVVMGYGKGSSKKGGIVVPIPANQKMKEFIIPIGKQYQWFNENNNWISLTSQGGSVEVKLIKISRGE
jgi:tetratricopeptide (TPR) repeat protein